jgi:hypothetical protein
VSVQVDTSSKQLARLFTALGDHRAGNRPDGIFAARLGGPGCVPELADLADAEWQLDLLPFPPTAEQVEALLALGYHQTEAQEGWFTFRHPDVLDVVLLSHDQGTSFEQKLLWAHLKESPEACQTYRMIYLHGGREAADARSVPTAQAEHLARTQFTPLEQVAALLRPLETPWMFAAGWALDLHRHAVLGAQPMRPHEDIDIVIGREAQFAVRDLLLAAGYSVHAVRKGMYTDWTSPVELPDHQVHAFSPAWGMLDLMLTDLGADTWHYRRNPAISLPMQQARRISPLGLPYLAPEAALLFKANPSQVRTKDQQDFGSVLPALNASEKSWLAAYIADEHAWQALLNPYTHSVQFPYSRNPTACPSISRNTYFFLLPFLA